jgi:hypothetical protein
MRWQPIQFLLEVLALQVVMVSLFASVVEALAKH